MVDKCPRNSNLHSITRTCLLLSSRGLQIVTIIAWGAKNFWISQKRPSTFFLHAWIIRRALFAASNYLGTPDGLIITQLFFTRSLLADTQRVCHWCIPQKKAVGCEKIATDYTGLRVYRKIQRPETKLSTSASVLSHLIAFFDCGLIGARKQYWLLRDCGEG